MAKTKSRNEQREKDLKHLIEGAVQAEPRTRWVVVDRHLTKVKLCFDHHRAMAECMRRGWGWDCYRVEDYLDSNERNDDDLPRTHDQRTQQPNT